MINTKTEDIMFLTFLLNNKTLIAGLILISIIAGGYGYIHVLKAENATIAAEKTTLTTQLTESQANIKQLQNDIQAQNTAVDKLKSDADARLAQNQKEVRAAQATASTYKQQAADLLKRQAAVNVPKCDAANSLINEEIKHVGK